MAKEQKTADELTALIMTEVRQHREWNDLMDVAIVRPVQSTPLHPNWDASFVVNGSRVPPEGAFQFVRGLQSKFDLA